MGGKKKKKRRGGNKNFKKGGGGGGHPGVLQFLRSEDCFDAPSLIPYAFVVRVENKIHIVNIAC